ncbi:polysaccharide deacetylase family protein [Microbacterium sp. SA39]|uniref:polysaccharide deacetylase family protein n=1 Tax=Microbacterium sp. SA39 TaxID=1263625 RepID=UPI0006983202|nr:polysaccharide deacetylase family protein [Microbacterium sp. SA39]
MNDHHQPAFALTIDFDAEELWLAESDANAARPGVLSQATYGVQFGVPALLELTADMGIPTTFFICGRDALRHPEAVEAISASGSEIGHHGLTHRSPDTLSRDEEERELTEALSILRRFSDDVVGYRSPSWDFSPHTLDLLESHQFEYSSNLMSAVHPFRHDSHALNELPVHWLLDDAPHFWFDSTSWDKTIRSTSEVLNIWAEEAEAIWDLGGTVTLTIHPQIIGRPSRVRMLRQFLQLVNDRGVPTLTAREAAARTVNGAGK